jgi:transposase
MSAEQAVLVEGWEEPTPASAPIPSSAPPRSKPKLRLQPLDRQQIVLEVVDTDRLVGQDHEVRALWDLLGRLDLSLFYEGIKALEGQAGRNHSHPQALVALWIYASLRGVQAGRELAEWSKHEPGCRWLLALRPVNHTTLSKFQTRYQAALHHLFVQVVHVLMAQGAVHLERLAHDGTKIRAAASPNSFKSAEGLAECRRAAEEQWAALEQQSDREGSARQRQAEERAAKERAERVRRAEEELKRQEEGKKASVTDPEARLMRESTGGIAPHYNAQISTDDHQGVILAYEVSQAREDSHELQSALDRIRENTERLPDQILVDGGYTTRQNILDTAERPTELIGSLGKDRSKSKLQGRGVSPQFMPEHFQFQAEQNCYTCPQGKALTYKGSKQQVGAIEKHYRAQASDCAGCPFRSQCCPKAQRGRTLYRTEEDPKVAAFRRKMQQPEYQRIYRRRAQVAEFSNACLKEKRGLRRFMRRGLEKARAELGLACLACNVAIWIRLQRKITPQAAT